MERDQTLAVQGTNDYSSVSKCSMVHYGYINDIYIQKFVQKYRRRSPLINRGYYIRAVAVDFVVRHFLKTHPKVKTQVLSLGAGFDSAFFRYASEGLLRENTFYELDFPRVVKRKARIIETDANLKRLAGDVSGPQIYSGVHSPSYHMIGVDIRNVNEMEAALKEHNFDFNTPTLILSEVVLTYLEPKRSDDIIGWCAAKMSRGSFVLYEQILPHDSFGKFMTSHFREIGSPLRSIATYPTLSSQIGRFLNLGWDSCESVDMNEFYHSYVTADEKRRLETLEPFDEPEGWHEMCAHYTLLCATSATVENPLSHSAIEGAPKIAENPTSFILTKFIGQNDEPNGIQRFGHSSVNVDGYIMTIGGFGRHSDGGHSRSSRIAVTSVTNGDTICLDGSEDLSRIHHTCNVLRDKSLIIIGGRQSPLKPCVSFVRCTVAVNDTHPPDEPISHAIRHTDTDTGTPKSSSVSPTLIPPVNLSVSSRPLTTMQDQFQPRWRHTTVWFEDSQGREKLMVYGGCTQQERATSDCWCLDVGSLTWTQIHCHGDGPGKRQSHSACVWGGWMVVHGGMDDTLTPQGSIHMLQLDTHEWKMLETVGSLVPRYSHSAHIHDDVLIILGGVTLSHQTAHLSLIHLPTAVTQHYHPPISSEIIFYHGHSTVFVAPSRIIFLGGGSNCFSFGTHFNRSPLIVDISPCWRQFWTFLKL